MRTKILLLCVFGAVLSLCKKEKVLDPQRVPTPYSIRMTDAPGPYDKINIDLQGVEITGNGNTVALNVNPGIYNLLDFSNGLDTLIATGSLDVEKVQQIRLILGNNNSVVVDSVSHPLTIPSSNQSGLKLQVHHDLQPGVAYSVLLDFDANQSVIQEGNGGYKLKPVIRTIETAISGSIKGRLSQPNVNAVITASSGSSVYSTIPNSAGDFVLKGLPAGTYSVSVTPVSPYNSTTINNVTVTIGNTTPVGIVNI